MQRYNNNIYISTPDWNISSDNVFNKSMQKNVYQTDSPIFKNNKYMTSSLRYV